MREELKLLCDNQTQTEGLSKEEIRKGLFQHIPKEFMNRGNEFDEELEEALKFIEEEGMAEKLTGERWILGEKI